MQLHQKLKDKGFVLVGLSDESHSKVGPYVKEHEIPFIMGSGSSSKTDWGVQGFPTAFVLDTTGKITFIGHPADPKFEEAVLETLKKTPPTKKGGFLDDTQAAEELAKAEKLVKSKQYPKAFKALEKVVEDYDGTPAAKKAKDLLAELKKDKAIGASVRRAEAAKQCNSWLRMARSLAKSGNREGAAKYYQRVIDQYGDTEFGAMARNELASLR